MSIGSHENIMMFQSIQAEKTSRAGSCKTCQGLKSFLRMAICASRKMKFIMKVTVPTETGRISLTTYGKQEIGDVPREAITESATPNPMQYKPAIKIRIRLIGNVIKNKG